MVMLTKKHISSKCYGIIRCQKNSDGTNEHWSLRCSHSQSFLFHSNSFQLPSVSNLPNMSRLAQLGNLQLILPHLRLSEGGGKETSSNGMKCHSVVAFMKVMVAKPDGEGLERSH